MSIESSCFSLKIAIIHLPETKVIPESKHVGFSTEISLVLGQEQDDFGGGFSLDQSTSMEVTQVNAWSHVLNATDIQDMAECLTDPQGDIIRWHLKDWRQEKVTYKYRELESLCEPAYERDKVIMTFGMAPDSQFSTCTALGGRLLAPEAGSKDPLESMNEKAQQLLDYLVGNGFYCV